MAESKLRARLRRLFSTNVIVRHAGGRKLKIADTNRLQQLSKDNLVDRYSRLYSNLATGGYDKSQQITFQSQRIGLFRDYEEMDNDAIISSALDIYADESTMRSEYGDVLTIQSDNENIYDITQCNHAIKSFYKWTKRLDSWPFFTRPFIKTILHGIGTRRIPRIKNLQSKLDNY